MFIVRKKVLSPVVSPSGSRARRIVELLALDEIIRFLAIGFEMTEFAVKEAGSGELIDLGLWKVFFGELDRGEYALNVFLDLKNRERERDERRKGAR